MISVLAWTSYWIPGSHIVDNSGSTGNGCQGYGMDKKLLDILACPICKGPLVFHKDENELICKVDRLAYPVRDGIPVMLDDEARQLPADEEV
jgi:uncharacterized protein YbaR (Trm112 family)